MKEIFEVVKLEIIALSGDDIFTLNDSRESIDPSEIGGAD